MPPKSKADSPPRMDGTSQGRTTELPPKRFIREELEQFGTMGTPANYFANLSARRSSFERSRFQMSEDRFQVLEQCLALTERFFAAALPYLANFLPDAKLDYSEHGKRLSIKEDLSIRGWKHMSIASRLLFREILPTITWTEDGEMWPRRRVMGLTHTGQLSATEAIRFEGPQEWEDYTEMCEEDALEYRHLTITLASQIVDAILASEPNTEQHMNALFAGAINITHELGHTIFLANMKNAVDYFWVGNDTHAEPGHSLVAYIFNGWYPEPINMGETDDNKDYMAFFNGHAWHKMHRRPCQEPFAEVMYSMPMEHIQRLFNQATWEEFRELNWENFATMRRSIFPPLSPFRIGRHARSAQVIKPGFWKRRISRSGFREEAADDEEDDWEDGIVYGPTKKEFFDADWDDAITEKDQAVQEESNRKYVIDLSDPGVTYISSDTDEDKPKKENRKGKKNAKNGSAKKATRTTKGTKEGKVNTPAKDDTLGTANPKRGRPARTATPGQSSTPPTGAKTSTGGRTTAGIKRGTKGRTSTGSTDDGSEMPAKTAGRKISGKKGGGKTPEDNEEEPAASSKKRARGGAKSDSKKSTGVENPEDNEEDRGASPKKRARTDDKASPKATTRAKSNPATARTATPKTKPTAKKPGSAP